MGMTASPPSVWAVHDGKIGMANQVLGLAEAVGWPFVEKRLGIRAPWRHLAPPLWFDPLAAPGAGGDRLAPPWPDLLIGCGRNAVAPALAVKRASGGRTFWVQIQDPRFGRGRGRPPGGAEPRSGEGRERRYHLGRGPSRDAARGSPRTRAASRRSSRACRGRWSPC